MQKLPSLTVKVFYRVVIEIDPRLKKELYAALRRNELNLKDWFVKSAESYITNNIQDTLPFEEYRHQTKEASNETV